jgi:acyl-CoA thioester hydrolase
VDGGDGAEEGVPVGDTTHALLPPHAGYVAHYRVRHHEMDALGHVNNAVYLHYLEQTAIQHSAALGYSGERLRALGGLFIASRHEIDYLRPAVAGDLLQVVTWVAEMGGARSRRDYAILRREEPTDGRIPADSVLDAGAAAPGELLVRARTQWAWVGVADGRPRRIPPALRAVFLAGLGGE